MTEFLTRSDIDSAAEVVRRRTRHTPAIGIILGSGLGALAEAVEDADVIPFTDVPGWPPSTVEGHFGRLVIGRLEGKSVLVMQGRIHYYEGYPMSVVGLPVRIMQALGIGTLIVTNAAGGVNPEFRAGELMLIKDHINFVGMAGPSPLRGPNHDNLGPRFPDMSQAYDHDLLALARRVAAEAGLPVREGVYTMLAGPSFETPADLRFLRLIGSDAVGMSTVPEVTVARHAGMRVLGISGISNAANLDGAAETTHEEVLATGQVLAPRLLSLVRGVLQRL